MVKKLKRKFVLTSMAALTLILVILVSVLNTAYYSSINSNADDLLRILSENEGDFPGGGFGWMDPQMPDGGRFMGSEGEEGAPGQDVVPPDARINEDGMRGPGRRLFRDNEIFGYNRTAETPYETRWFWVIIDGSGAVSRADTSHIASVDEDTAKTIAGEVAAAGKQSGNYGDYRYLLGQAGDGDQQIAVFLERREDYHSARLLFATSLIVSLLILLLMFLLVTLMSGRAVAPTVEALEKQKQFISDASHELKTPLSVISADVDVMEMTGEKSEWTASIRDQVTRMNQLIRDMLTLSRMEEGKIRVVFSDLDLSETVRKAAGPFSVVAKAAGKSYETEIESGLHVLGDEKALEQLVTILSDNALKYSSEGSAVNLLLKNEGKNVRLEISNTCEKLPEGNLDRLFDRFYRADTSRNRSTGGFGIGLSVARAIVTAHGGKIHAERDGDHIIRFIATVPASHSQQTS